MTLGINHRQHAMRVVAFVVILMSVVIASGCAKKKKVAAAIPPPTPSVSLPPAIPPRTPSVSQAPAVPRVGATETGIASWYGYPYHGRRAANGEIYDMEKLTAAHRTLPFETWVACTISIPGRM